MRSVTSFALPLGLALLGFIFTPACGSDDVADSATAGETGGDGDSGGDGATECGNFGNQPVSCQPGQYCADAVLSICENGCLTNDNCAADQTCEKLGGEDVGTCQNNAPGGPTEAEFCEKLLTCDMTGTMEQCSIFYTGTNEACHQCIVDGNCGDINGGSCDAACGL